MAQQTINVGTAPNDGTGTPLRTAFQYTNSNFSELYTAVGPSGNNIVCPGSATITGDLTVDTSTLKVASASNQVGVGITTFTGTQSLQVLTGVRISDANPESLNCLNLAVTSTTSTIETRYGTPLIFGTNATECYRIAAGGASTWSVGGSTAMSLNSSGNLGLGVTPSAWNGSYKGFQIGSATAVSSVNLEALFSSNYFRSATQDQYIANGFATLYRQASGIHYWYNAASGTAGNAITFTQAMTLDASGNLLVGTTTAEQKLTVFGAASINGGVLGQGALISRDGSSGGANYGSNTGNTSLNAPASGTIRFNVNNGTFAGQFDTSGNLIWSPSATPPTLGTNGQLTVNATSNTNLRFSFRGSDGVTRVANITLA